jgi:hypothetical protein
VPNKFKRDDKVKFAWPPTVPRQQWAGCVAGIQQAIINCDAWIAHYLASPVAMPKNGQVSRVEYSGTVYRIVDDQGICLAWMDETWLEADAPLPPSNIMDRDFDGFCDKATHPDFAGWCGGRRFHRIGCPSVRKS